MIDIEKIKVDPRAQSRVKLCEATIGEYAEAYSSGVQFPPITLFYDKQDYWLADGFHRYLGAKKAGKKQILEEVTPGTLRDAILYAIGANALHGLQRTKADKRKAVQMLLSDEEWGQWSSREIARKCSVSHTLVDDVRNSHLAELPDSQPKKRKVQRGGTTYEQAAKPATAVNPTDVPAPITDLADEPEYTELDQAHEQIAELQNAISIAAKGELGEEEKAEALNLVDGLRAEIRTLTASLKAVTASRNLLQQENSELKTQIRIQRKEIDKLAGSKTA